MLDVEGVLGVALLLLWVYCIFDVIASDSALVRNLPKMFWLFIVLILPDVGAIAWLLLGRPEKAGWRPGDSSMREARWGGGRAPVEPVTSDESLAERDRLIAQWEIEEEARKQERRQEVDRINRERRQAAEDELIHNRRLERERERKKMEAPLPDPEPGDPPALN
jgi:hypothetical protein